MATRLFILKFQDFLKVSNFFKLRVFRHKDQKNRNFSLFIRYESTKRSPKSPLCWSLWVKFFKSRKNSGFEPFSTGSFGDYKLPESTVTPLIQDYDQKIPKFRLAWSQNASFFILKKKA